jgi:hypothetical protein
VDIVHDCAHALGCGSGPLPGCIQLKTTRLVPIIASGNVNDKLTYVLASIATSYDGADLLSGSLNVTNFQFGITPSPATRYPTPTEVPTLAPTAAKDYNSRQPTFNPTYEDTYMHTRERPHAHAGTHTRSRTQRFMPLERRPIETMAPVDPALLKDAAKITLRYYMYTDDRGNVGGRQGGSE